MHLFGGIALLVIAVAAWRRSSACSGARSWSPLTLVAIVLGVLLPVRLFLFGLQAETLAAMRTEPPYSIRERVG